MASLKVLHVWTACILSLPMQHHYTMYVTYSHIQTHAVKLYSLISKAQICLMKHLLNLLPPRVLSLLRTLGLLRTTRINVIPPITSQILLFPSQFPNSPTQVPQPTTFHIHMYIWYDISGTLSLNHTPLLPQIFSFPHSSPSFSHC